MFMDLQVQALLHVKEFSRYMLGIEPHVHKITECRSHSNLQQPRCVHIDGFQWLTPNSTSPDKWPLCCGSYKPRNRNLCNNL